MILDTSVNVQNPTRNIGVEKRLDGVELLLSYLANKGAAIHWRRMKARQPDEAQGALAWLLRRRWGLTALRENARLTLERLQYIGLDRRDHARAKQAEFRASKRGKARADALELSMLGPKIGDTRPAVATRWA